MNATDKAALAELIEAARRARNYITPQTISHAKSTQDGWQVIRDLLDAALKANGAEA